MSLFFASSFALSACAAPGPKIYISRPKEGGAVRAQDGELLPYEQTDGAYIIFPKDMELIVMEAKQRLGKERCEEEK